MKNDTAHMGIIKIEDMSHLPVCNGCFEKAQLNVPSKDCGLFFAADRREYGQSFRNGRMLTASEYTADPVEDTALCLMNRNLRQIIVCEPGEKSTQILGNFQVEGRCPIFISHFNTARNAPIALWVFLTPIEPTDLASVP